MQTAGKQVTQPLFVDPATGERGVDTSPAAPADRLQAQLRQRPDRWAHNSASASSNTASARRVKQACSSAHAGTHHRDAGRADPGQLAAAAVAHVGVRRHGAVRGLPPVAGPTPAAAGAGQLRNRTGRSSCSPSLPRRKGVTVLTECQIALLYAGPLLALPMPSDPLRAPGFRSTFAPPDARPRGTGRNDRGRRVAAEAIVRPFAHVKGDDRDQAGTGRYPRGDGGATCKIAGIAYTGSNPVPAT